MKRKIAKYMFGALWLMLLLLAVFTVWTHGDAPQVAAIRTAENPAEFFAAVQNLTLTLRARVADMGFWLMPAYVLAYTLRPLVFFPTSILTSSSVFLFGPVWGFFLTYIGESFSAQVAFWAARFFGRSFLEHKNNKVLKAFDALFKKNGFTAVLTMRLVPLFPFDVVNYSCGLSPVSWRAYTLATAIGVLPGLTAYILLAAGITDDTRYLWWSAGLFVVLIAGGMLYKKYNRE